jgi:predicted phage-related endonuclease
MQYKIIDAPQGSEAWLQARKDCNTASEAPAALGVSKYQARDELLSQKKTGLTKEVDAATQRLFDRGHETEALARVIAEEIIGEELYPITVKREVDGMPLLASMDGLTMIGDIGFEHKLVSQDLIDQIKAQSLEPHYTVQMDQQILVTGAQKILFMASDGTKENCHWMWYESTQAKQAGLIASWKQFERDLAAYVPPVQVEKVVAETVEALPVPSVVVKGELVSCNLGDITPHFDNYLANINTTLATDQDFANAEADAKNCRESAKKLDAVTEAIIAQMGDVNRAITILGEYSQKLNKMGLQLEKAVKDQKESVKTQAIMKAQAAWQDYISAMQDECEPVALRQHLTSPDFAGSIKGIKTIASMHSRINDALAAGKAQAKQFADDVRTKIELINTSITGYEHLFNVSSLAVKDLDFIKLNIQSVKDAEDKRKADHEAEIQEKAEADARAKIEAEQRAKEPKPVIVEQTFISEPSEQALKPVTRKTSNAEVADSTQLTIVRLVANHYGISEQNARETIIGCFGLKKAA